MVGPFRIGSLDAEFVVVAVLFSYLVHSRSLLFEQFQFQLVMALILVCLRSSADLSLLDALSPNFATFAWLTVLVFAQTALSHPSQPIAVWARAFKGVLPSTCFWRPMLDLYTCLYFLHPPVTVVKTCKVVMYISARIPTRRPYLLRCIVNNSGIYI